MLIQSPFYINCEWPFTLVTMVTIVNGSSNSSVTEVDLRV